MLGLKSLSLLLIAGLAAALPAPSSKATNLVLRQSNGATCGNDQYSSDQINDALNAGCNYLNNGETVGRDNYPHQYNDDEGFDFSTSSPWYEFPILEDGQVFDGSTGPGADRVIFDGNCDFTAVITHTGASGNGFVECQF